VETKSSSSSEEEWVNVSSAPSLSGSDFGAPATDSASSDAAPQEPEVEASRGESSSSEVSGASVETPAAAAQPTRSAEEWKQLGNESVKAGDHAAAFESYSAGLAVDPDHAILLSNRALVLHTLGRLEEGLADARRCVSLRPDFIKGYLRSAKLLRELGRPQEAMEVLRRAPLNEEVEKLSAEVKPEAEAAEEQRIASLDGAERKKEEGNALFKKGLFEQALPVYNEALARCSDSVGELALAIRNNRAGCYHQLSNFERVVEDTTFVLEQQPDNLKALMRRMIALEPLEKYEAALRDARNVLRQIPGHEAANKLQHRLSRLVREQAREKSSA
jgi:stress-induced-phosphoprotein 1